MKHILNSIEKIGLNKIRHKKSVSIINAPKKQYKKKHLEQGLSSGDDDNWKVDREILQKKILFGAR